MMKVIMIYDQIQSGMGTKDDKTVPLGGKNEIIGPAMMMKPFLKQYDLKIQACLYCGTDTFKNNEKEVSRKLCAMVNKLNADLVICGPAFNYHDYAEMASKICLAIHKTTNAKAITAMSVENEAIIAAYKEEIPILKMPKKGGFGLNDSLMQICEFAAKYAKNEDVSGLDEYRY